jgi:hypothetical protein
MTKTISSIFLKESSPKISCESTAKLTGRDDLPTQNLSPALRPHTHRNLCQETNLDHDISSPAKIHQTLNSNLAIKIHTKC